MTFYLVRSLSTPRVLGSHHHPRAVQNDGAPASRVDEASAPAQRPAAPVPASSMREALTRSEVGTNGGHVLRDVLARCAAARAYGGAGPRELDFIDVPFEEVREAKAPVLPAAARSLRALRSENGER